MSQAIAVFAKAPLPGRVKTRLRTCMTAAQAAELHAAFAADTWQRLAVLTGVRRYLYCDQVWEPFEGLAGPEHFAIQHGVDLGARMLNCMKELSLGGHDRILLLGSDSPTLPIAHVEQAFLALDRTDTVLGPTADGGYYAAGCRRPDTRMFAGVTWSSEDTLRATEAAFRACSLSVSHLPEWYDVDTGAELARLAAEPGLPPNTRRWLDGNPDVMQAVSGGRD
ncbi:MAG: TIGR04282 family arsenosugar biosynthesis glycosyltransferase [Bryobacterales bacterium]|nr:TIGR04282 family arsenosugar biosynthesis glycosyltransferase [Bryobacterales bacterium]